MTDKYLLVKILRHCQSQLQSIRSHSKNINGVLLIRQMNQAQYLKELISLLDQPAFITDNRGQIIIANQLWCDFCSVEQTKISALSLAEICPSLRLPSSAQELLLVFQFKQQKKDPIRVKVAPLGREHFFFSVCCFGPLGERNSEFHCQRLQTLGMLAGGIAHDFNNILTGLLGHISYLQTILPGAGKHCESLEAIADGARKASLITQQILNFSRLETTEELLAVDLVDLSQRMYTLLRGAISPRYDLALVTPQEPLLVRGVEGKLAQIIVNLVINARDALEPNGRIELNIGAVPATNDLRRHCKAQQLEANSYARLAVTDNGKGMTADVIARACQPYFTTKGKLGTGLGLATVSSIVTQLGGAIVINSQLTHGTSVEVFLPLDETIGRQDQQQVNGSQKLTLQGGSESILIVDDEDPVRNVILLSLEHLGYRVTAADSGEKAVALYSQAPDSFDLVILDMLMPQMSGDQVFFRLQSLKSDVKVILMSGFSSEQAVQTVLDSGGLDFIQKPFTIEELSRKVRDSLDV